MATVTEFMPGVVEPMTTRLSGETVYLDPVIEMLEINHPAASGRGIQEKEKSPSITDIHGHW